MNIRSWFALGKRPAPMPAGTPGTGPVTGVELGRLDMLVRPFAQGPFYRLRPPFSYEAAALSLELADMAYTLELDAWTQAGASAKPETQARQSCAKGKKPRVAGVQRFQTA